jgi:hypothetical protein
MNQKKMKTKSILFALALFSLIGISACRHTVDYSQFPEVKYSTDVNPIIIANCTQSRCHGLVESERFDLLTYDNVIRHGGIVAGKPHKSNFYNVISTLNPYNIMPVPPQPALTDEQIKTVFLWIAQGAKNN